MLSSSLFLEYFGFPLGTFRIFSLYLVFSSLWNFTFFFITETLKKMRSDSERQRTNACLSPGSFPGCLSTPVLNCVKVRTTNSLCLSVCPGSTHLRNHHDFSGLELARSCKQKPTSAIQPHTSL